MATDIVAQGTAAAAMSALFSQEGRSFRRLSGRSRQRLIPAGPSGIYFSNGFPVQLTSTYGRNGTTRLPFQFPVAVRSIQAEFWNGLYTNSGGVEYPNPNPITIACALETPPALNPMPFENGEIYTVLKPGARIKTNRVGVSIAAGGVVTLDTYFAVSKLGMYLPANVPGHAASGPTNIGTSQATGYPIVAGTSSPYTGFDYTQKYGFPSGRSFNTGVFAFGPTALWGEPVNDLPAFAIFGDSIANGTNDTGGSPAVDLYFAGYIARGLGSTYPYGKFSMPGSIAANPIKFGGRKLDMIGNIDYWIWEYGINDINGGTYTTLAAMQSAYLAYWAQLAAMGAKGIACTLLPFVNTTDNLATAANQTPAANGGAGEAIRTGYNSWLRDTSANGAIAQSNGALVAISDPCALIEVNASNVLTLNGGRWLTNGTNWYYAGPDNSNTQAIHPTTAGATLIQTAVTNIASGLTL